MKGVRHFATASFAVIGAWWLEGAAVGLGLSVVLLALFAAAANRDPLWLLAAALAVVPAIRAAGWVQALSVAGALTVAALAAGGFATLGQAVRTVGRATLMLVPGPFLVGAALVERARGNWARGLPAARGLALAAVVLTPFVALFASADAAFAEWVQAIGDAAPDLGPDLTVSLLIAAALLAVGGALLFLRPAPPPAPATAGPLGRTEWVMVLGALNALFAAFVLAQVTVLFGGHEHVLRTAGLTYAEYAREGFGQLLTAASLTLAVMAAARRYATRATPADERLQRALLGGLSVMTLVVLASAHRRLGLYVEAFGQTSLRVLAGAVILWLGAVFVVLMAAHRSARLPRALVALTGTALLVFALSNPEGRVAARNVERYEATGRLDPYTLAALSEDAVPAVVRLPADLRREAMPDIGRDRALAAFNLARRRARAAAAEGGRARG